MPSGASPFFGDLENRSLPVTGGAGFIGKAPLGSIDRCVRAAFKAAQKVAYRWYFDTKIEGVGHIPLKSGFLVAANHASHLDMGLIKQALGSAGEELMSLAAKDYFFSSSLGRFFFGRFTNLVPLDRCEPKESLRYASSLLGQGRNLLIFPEGTRSLDGRINPFKPSIGYLALKNQVDVLPIYLEGTYEALPKGWLWPRARRLRARIGPAISFQELSELAQNRPNNEAYRLVTARVEQAVRALESAKLPQTIPDLAEFA
ncbi:MAG: 1-acyl-sn-glycerol-3-phosphate acyltransferase [Elusimicrobia bacterium]|nr:1-acyl-sn-glycerol-3-phosphate acyltransferase [Elusimicrobiota bacterium]